MRFREIQPEDFEQIREINNQSIHKYDLDSPEFVLGGVAVDDKDNIVGFGAVKIIHECVIMLDQRKSRRSRVEAAKELIRVGTEKSRVLGIRYWHAFCDFEFALFLERWGFKSCQGEVLVLSMGGSNVQKRREEDAGEIAGGQVSLPR